MMFIPLASSNHSLIHVLFQSGNKLVPPTCKCEKTSNHNQINNFAGGLKHLGLKQVRARFVDISCFSGNGMKEGKDSPVKLILEQVYHSIYLVN